MSIRALFGLFAMVALFVSSVSLAGADERGGPCFGGLVSETDESGLLAGSDCSDVILASTATTSIQGGGGEDVIIGGDNVVLIEGGSGDDLIFGDGFASVLLGGAGDDIVDAGPPVLVDEMDEATQDHLAMASVRLPEDERADFLAEVEDALTLAQDEERIVLDQDLREQAIHDSTLIEQIAGPRDVVVDEDDDELMSEIQVLRADAQAYSDQILSYVNGPGGMSSLQSGPPDLIDQIIGTAGSDWLYGGRGNDDLRGAGGNDQLYGGVGDDTLRGQADDDYMLGGMGSDKINGGEGDDVAQGDATGDRMIDTGGPTDSDVISYASGGTPGFPGRDMSAYPNFPSGTGERGVYIDLANNVATNGTVVGAGGGTDPYHPTDWDKGSDFSSFEHVVGTPFADVIKGDAGDNVLQGGGGADIIEGGGGVDVLLGEAGGDNLTAGAGSWLVGGQGDDFCAGSTVVADCEPAMPSNWVAPRDTGSIAVGMTSQSYAGNVKSQLYLAGSTGNWVAETGADVVTVTEHATPVGQPPIYTFSASGTANQGQFSLAAEDQTPGCSYTATLVTCVPTTNVVTMVLAGFGGNDTIEIQNVSRQASTIFIGGTGNDTLTGGNYAEDFMHDGEGNDVMLGLGADDGLVNTDGGDDLFGGFGDDLILSNVICQADDLSGGGGFDNASWAMYRAEQSTPPGSVYGLFANLAGGFAGRKVGSTMDCSGMGPAIQLAGIEDLEGTKHNDALYGDAGVNRLLGRATPDLFTAYNGSDRISANAADNDTVHCGAGTQDGAVIDWPAIATDWTDGNCDVVRHRDPAYTP